MPDLWAGAGALFVVSGFTLVNVGSKSFEEKHCWGGREGRQQQGGGEEGEEEEEDARRHSYEQGGAAGIN